MSNNQPLIFGHQPAAVNQPAATQGNFSGRNAKPVSAYINVSLPRSDGSVMKIDRGLRLYFDDKDPGQQQLAEFLQTPEGVEWFRTNMVVSCNVVTDEPKTGFDFGK